MKFALAQEEWHDVLQESDADIAYEHFIHKLLSYTTTNTYPLSKLKHLKRTSNLGSLKK